MTSPRQRKKRLALKKFKEKQKLEEQSKLKAQVSAPVVKKEEPKQVAAPQASVVESAPEPKVKKPKIGLTELKSQDQVVEQPKEEVKTQPKE